MNRSLLRHLACRIAIVASLIAVFASVGALAQIPTIPTKVTPPPKLPVKVTARPAKPAVVAPKAVAAKTATPTVAPTTVAKPVTTSSPSATTPLSSYAPGTILNQSGVPGTSLLSPSQPVSSSGAAPSNSMYSGSPNAPDPRAPVAGQGIGTFLWQGGWTLTAYGCFRTGTRLFCDFDTTNQNNLPANTTIWSGAGGVNLVDDGGKITQRHNAFFVGDDGSQFQTAYISPQPVRFIIEYDDVDTRYTSVSLVYVRDRIQGVPITLIDPSQPAGRMPPRGGARSVAPGVQQTAQPGASGVLDKATTAVNNVSTQGKQAESTLKSLQGTVQSH